MSRIMQPVGQIKLTNVSMVRLKKGKKRFEIACYKNKVLEWRQGIETDLDNVLQIPNVFLNVSKGQTAPAADLSKAFGKDYTVDKVILEILKKGELQVGDKERAAQLDRLHHEVIDIVANKLVDPRTKRVYTPTMIEKALGILKQRAEEKDKEQKEQKEEGTAEATAAEDDKKNKIPRWTGVTTTKSAKAQALEAMKALVALQPIPVMRARMRLRISCPTNVLKQAVKAPKVVAVAEEDDSGSAPKKATGTVKDRILSYIEHVESQDVVGGQWEAVGSAEPGALKILTDFVSNETRGQARVEILDVAVTHDD